MCFYFSFHIKKLILFDLQVKTLRLTKLHTSFNNQLTTKKQMFNYIPLGGKYDLLSALWGQSTTNGPNRRNADIISSTSKENSTV